AAADHVHRVVDLAARGRSGDARLRTGWVTRLRYGPASRNRRPVGGSRPTSEEPFEHRSERLRVDHVSLAFEGPTFGPWDARGDRVRGPLEEVVAPACRH